MAYSQIKRNFFQVVRNMFKLDVFYTFSLKLGLFDLFFDDFLPLLKVDWWRFDHPKWGAEKKLKNLHIFLNKVLTGPASLHRMRTSSDGKSGSPKSPSSRGLGHRPFTAVTGVRIP